MSERPFPAVVALRDRASGRYLTIGASWSDDAAGALRLDERAADDIVRRFACEPAALEVVALDDVARAVA